MVNGPAAGYIFLCSDATESECLAKRGHGVNGIDPGAFRGAFQAQQPVERTAECTPVSVKKLNSIVKFYQYGRFYQNLDAHQVAKLSALMRLRPLRPALSPAAPAQGNSSAAAQDKAAVMPKPAAADEPSASCRVSHGTATAKATEGSKAADSTNGNAANGKSDAAPAAAPQAASNGATQPSIAPNGAAAQARSNGAQLPLAFQLNGLKSIRAGTANASKPGRKLSLASVLDDIFEEVRSTPRSSRRRKRHSGGSTQKAEAAPAALAVLPMSPIDLTVSGSEGESVPVHEQQAATASEAVEPHQGISQQPAAPLSNGSAQPEVEKASVAPVEVSATQAAPPVPILSLRQPTQVHAGSGPCNSSSQQQARRAAQAPALTKEAPTCPQPTEKAPEQSGAAQPNQAAAVTQSKVTDTGQQPKVLPLVPGSALICACSAQEADKAFNKHQLPLPQRLREGQPQAVIRQGMRVFLHNADTRRLLGPFYAQQTRASELEVSVTEREPVQALREADILAKLTPAVQHLADLGPVTQPGVCQQICHVFEEAAAPNRVQPYRMLGGKLGGAVFVCSTGTVQSCLAKSLLGMMQDTYIPIVQHISVGMPVFLFNHSDRTLIGPLSAVSPGGMYIEERAWARPGHKSPWPAQVRVAVHQPIIALKEKDFRPLIDTAYYSSNTFHFDLTQAEALRLLEMFTHRQVTYHQHRQHRLGNPCFVPPAICQQLLEAARQASKPTRQPARRQQTYTNAYLDVLEKGLTTQKKPAKRPEEETPPALPALDDIVSIEAKGLEPGEIATGSDVQGTDGGSRAAELAHDQYHSREQRSAEVAVQDGRPTLPGESGAQGASAAGVQQAQGGARSGLRLLERFDAARQLQREPAGASAATGGAPALGAAPAKPSPLGRLQLPMLSPLVLSSAPHHTPLQPPASSAPAIVQPACSAAYTQQGSGASLSTGQAIGDLTPLQGARPEEHSAAQQPASTSSFSFRPLGLGASQGTPPSFAKLLQEYASPSSQAEAGSEPAAAVVAAKGASKTSDSLSRKRRRERRQRLRETLKVASQDQKAAEAGPEESPAQQAAAAAPPEQSSPSLGSTPAMTAVIDVPDLAGQLQVQQLGGPMPQTPTLELQQQRGIIGDNAGCSLAYNDNPRLRFSWEREAQDLPEGLLDLPLAGVIEEAAQAGRKLPAVRRGQLAAALQSAAFAAAQLQQALQSASNILGFDLEAGTPGSHAMPPLEYRPRFSLLQHRAQQPHSSASALRTAIAAQQGAPLQTADRLPAMHTQPTASKKRNRSEGAIDDATEGISAGLAKKKQRRLQPQQAAPDSKANPSKRALKKQRQGKQQPPAGQQADTPSAGMAPSELPAALDRLPTRRMALSALKRMKEATLVCEGVSHGQEGNESSREASAEPVAAQDHEAAPQAQPAAGGSDMEASGNLARGAAAQLAVDPQADEQASETVSGPPVDLPRPPLEEPPGAPSQKASQQPEPQNYRPVEHPSLLPGQRMTLPPTQPFPGLHQPQLPGNSGQGHFMAVNGMFPCPMAPGIPMQHRPLQLHNQLSAPPQPGLQPWPQALQTVQTGPWPALQQTLQPTHSQLLVLNAPWNHQQQQGGLVAPPQQPSWPHGQPWAPVGQPGRPPAPMPQPPLGPALGQLLGRPPAPAPPPLLLQPPLTLSAPLLPPQHPRIAQGPLPAPVQLQPPAAPTTRVPSPQHPRLEQARKHYPHIPCPALETTPAQQLPVHPCMEQAQLHSFAARAQPGQNGPAEGSGQGTMSSLATERAVHAGSAATAQQQQPDAVQAFQFKTGEVGSVIMSKKKQRRGKLANLEKELAQQRAAFMRWHQQELQKAQATGKPKAVRKKQKAVVVQLAQKHGDAQTLEQVKAAGKAALLATGDDGSANAGDAPMDGSAAREGQRAPGEAAAQGQEAAQNTPLPQSVGVKRKRLQVTVGTLSKLVAFDTNVYMSAKPQVAKVIAQCLRQWSLIFPSILILVPVTVMSELNGLATGSKIQQVRQLAAAGQQILKTVLDSRIAHVQLPEELPEGCSTNRVKDDGILDCLRYFKEKGHHIFLCTLDKQFACRSQAQGIEAIPPDLLGMRPEYPLHVEMTPLPARKRSKPAETAEASDAAGTGAATMQHSAPDSDFIAL